MSDTERFELEDLEDAEDAGRYIKCECERLMELNHVKIQTVEVSVDVVSMRHRYNETGTDWGPDQ